MKVLINKGSMSFYAEGPGEMAELDKVDNGNVNMRVMPDKLTANVTGPDMYLWSYLADFARIASEAEVEVKLY